MHIRQPEVAALETVRELRVIEAEQVQHRGVEIVHGNFVDHGLVTEVVRLAVAESAFHPAAGHPERERAGIVIAPDEFHIHAIAILAHGRATKLAAPHDKRVLEQSVLLEVGDERHEGAVHLLALVLEAVT